MPSFHDDAILRGDATRMSKKRALGGMQRCTYVEGQKISSTFDEVRSDIEQDRLQFSQVSAVRDVDVRRMLFWWKIWGMFDMLEGFSRCYVRFFILALTEPFKTFDSFLFVV